MVYRRFRGFRPPATQPKNFLWRGVILRPRTLPCRSILRAFFWPSFRGMVPSYKAPASAPTLVGISEAADCAR